MVFLSETFFDLQNETMDYIVHGFRPENENFEIGQKSFHQNEQLKRSKMVQISAS